MFKKLRNRFLILNMVITSLVMLVAFSAVYLTTANNMHTENQRKLNSMSMSLMVSSESAPEQPESGRMINMVSADYSPSFTLIVDKGGSIVNIDTIMDLPAETFAEAAAAAWQKGGQSTVSLSGRLWLYAITQLSVTELYEDGRSVTKTSSDNYQISFLDITDTQKTLRDLLLTFVLVGFAMLAVIFLVSLYFANRSIQPIAAAWEKQRQFVADASHELKTPLSIITANYDALLSNQDETIRSQHEWLDYMKIGTDRMAKLINDMLTLAKMENAGVEVSRAPFDLSDTLSRDMASMAAATAEKGLTLSKAIEGGIVINSDREMIRRVLAILLENAIKYSEPDGEILVSLEKSKYGVICSVRNSGKGIAPKDLPRIFDRFYRADKSRTGEKGGYGLGLSIAQTIIRRLGGDIMAQSVENEGTVFTFTLEEAR